MFCHITPNFKTKREFVDLSIIFVTKKEEKKWQNLVALAKEVVVVVLPTGTIVLLQPFECQRS
jgi:hypothetical protein